MFTVPVPEALRRVAVRRPEHLCGLVLTVNSEKKIFFKALLPRFKQQLEKKKVCFNM